MHRKFYLSSLFLLLLVIVGGSLFANGALFQGRFVPDVLPSADPLIVNVCSGSMYVSVAVSSSTPREDIVIAGESDVALTHIQLTGKGEAFVLTDLSFKNRNSGVAGDADNNISTLSLQYTSIEEESVVATGVLVNGVVSFSGLELYVPKDDSAEATLYADLVDISSSGSSATAGELIELSPRTLGGAAVGETTGKTYKLCATSRSALSASNPMHVYETRPSFGLNRTSPSGSRTVSVTDEVFAFDVMADSAEDVTLQELTFDLISSADFNTSATVSAILEQSGTEVGSATVTIVDASTAYATFSDDIVIAAADTAELTLVLDTASLLDEDAGIDDPFTVSIDYGSSSDGTVTHGGVTWYDTNATVYWIGATASTALSGNTLKY